VGLVAFGGALFGIANGCIDPSSPLLRDTAEGCDEFVAGAEVSSRLKVHPKVRAFMQAASDFVSNADEIKVAVMTACTKVATDLGAPETWQSIADKDKAITNADRTGACDAAGSRIERVLIDAEKVNAHVAVAVSNGECHLDFEEQKKCDAECALSASCNPGTIETRCDSEAISVTCSGTCNAGASCVGSVDVAANCMGRCESECTGDCSGTCIAEDGSMTSNDSNAKGKCIATCNGKCKGTCRIEAPEGVACGDNVRCTGGCTGTATDPACTTEFKPPPCDVDEDCHAACTAKVAQHAVCQPPTIRIYANIDVTPEMKEVVATLEENLPDLFSAADVKGRLLLGAAERLGDTGRSLAARLEDLDGKSLACLGEAATAVGDTIASVDVVVRASVDVTLRTTEHAD
jgi:hypothetical protein